MDHRPGETIYSQGDPSDTLFYIQQGTVKLTVVSPTGREAVVGMLGGGDFFGEGALARQPVRVDTATAVAAGRIRVIPKTEMIRLLHEQHGLSDRFIAYLLARNSRLEQDLVDQLLNACEQRLARALLLLAHYGKLDGPRPRAAHDLSRGARGDGGNDAVACECLHDQVQETRLDRLRQGRPHGSPHASQCHAARCFGFRSMTAGPQHRLLIRTVSRLAITCLEQHSPSHTARVILRTEGSCEGKVRTVEKAGAP